MHVTVRPYSVGFRSHTSSPYISKFDGLDFQVVLQTCKSDFRNIWRSCIKEGSREKCRANVSCCLVPAADMELGGASSKENRQQAGNVALPQPGLCNRQSGQSSDLEQGKRLSSRAAAGKTRRNTRLSETRTSTSSAGLDSEGVGPASDQAIAHIPTHATVDAQTPFSQAASAALPATQDSQAQDSVAESAVCQALDPAEPVSHEPPARMASQTVVTPVKAAQSGGRQALAGPHVLQSDKLQHPVAVLHLQS